MIIGRLNERLRRQVERFLREILHTYWRFSRGVTLGVRALVVDDQRRIFLIRHTYVRGWQLPGGGVEVGELLIEALARELSEEGNIELDSAMPPVLFGMYFNGRVSRRDHIALFVVRAFSQPRPPTPDLEIAAHGFFPVFDLPADTTVSTRARMADGRGGAPPSGEW